MSKTLKKLFKNTHLLRALLATLILFIPLYPKFPLSSVTGTYVAIRLDDIVVALALFFLLLDQIKNRFSLLKKPISKLFIAYFIAIITSNILALLIYKIDPKNILILHLLRRFEYMSLFFLTVQAIKDKKDLKVPAISLLISTFLVSLYGLGQKYLSFPVVSTMNSEFSKGQLLQLDTWTRISSTFAGHYDLAAFLSVALVIIFGLFLLSKKSYQKIPILLVWILGFYILTLTASRVSTFAFWGGITLSLILIRKYLWILPTSALMVFSIFNSADLNQRLIATIGTIKLPKTVQPTPIPTAIPTPTTPAIKPTKGPVAIISTPIPTVVRHGPIDEFIPVDVDAGVARSGEIRFNAEWPRALTAFSKNRLNGSGLGSITLATDNDYLRLLGESGLLGFLTFLAIPVFFLISSTKDIFVKKQNHFHKYKLILAASLITMMANATLIDVFEASKTAYLFWIMMGVYYQILIFSKNDKSN